MPRVYVPATVPDLRAWSHAIAVPADAERVVAADDEEQSEYDALMTAADLSAELPGSDGRRVVVVVEPDPSSPSAADGEGELAWRRVVALHADESARSADADPDDDLAWFAPQELDVVLG